jgi:hypothetical protein
VLDAELLRNFGIYTWSFGISYRVMILSKSASNPVYYFSSFFQNNTSLIFDEFLNNFLDVIFNATYTNLSMEN